MDIKRKLFLTREVIFFCVSALIGLAIYGFGDIIGNSRTKKIGIFLGIFIYIFYQMFRVSWRWFLRCNKYPLD